MFESELRSCGEKIVIDSYAICDVYCIKFKARNVAVYLVAREHRVINYAATLFIQMKNRFR